MGLLSPEIRPGTCRGPFSGYPGTSGFVKTFLEVFVIWESSLNQNLRENFS
jgi:hypothetical protein